ncbi:unnamed protein product [Didymodactylos carnosus]|uniref:Uncharacterized protein n=1 Tax=Didymodactylos carnosus TaxID=1234261 RepID=A0A8S2HG80_9BILA|nr:unnamed protein product [Didymodactylos carnosus]CAF3639750.1 unnamed protein product [Didymodactylos carnosus]
MLLFIRHQLIIPGIEETQPINYLEVSTAQDLQTTNKQLKVIDTKLEQPSVTVSEILCSSEDIPTTTIQISTLNNSHSEDSNESILLAPTILASTINSTSPDILLQMPEPERESVNTNAPVPESSVQKAADQERSVNTELQAGELVTTMLQNQHNNRENKSLLTVIERPRDGTAVKSINKSFLESTTDSSVVNDIKQIVTNNDGDFTKSINRIAELLTVPITSIVTQRLEQFELKIDDLERRSRSHNLRFHGIKEEENP